ncbi:hypothetical protein PUMCH_001089 [Australozyma saopauloensis]|uniref:dynamin GTPase n=1 Tax=Australozyma saopauloensis TaxID=291208 RepID=A0AAX4H5S6_9ASCO|nr:hypothetical protein PUMCH_001089 [[Candida] saopauloensis]
MLSSVLRAELRRHTLARSFTPRGFSVITSNFHKPGLLHNTTKSALATRNLGFFKVVAKAVKLPAYIGGTVAAGGSYIAYKVDQASTYTNDKLSAFKDFTSDVFNKTGDFFKSAGGGSESSGNSSGGPDGSDAAAVGATAAAVGLSADDDEEQLTLDDEDEDEDEEDEETLIDQSSEDTLDLSNDETADEMLNLTRQMIEIRNILTRVDSQSDTLKLPSIVVVGSQSSGKSSVLEAIVGQEFLPKGNNMVTRRPIELTLVNAPESASETAEFPALNMYNMTDFQTVQKTLFDLNMAVPASECISNDPIQITIRSPRVPDLSLVDLPGYIQVEADDQPAELKQKIRTLCNRYLEAPNIILAISSADVDLANSSALRAAKMADPRGERTVGVITKMDLVDPKIARRILLNRKYPLRMGYVGVITKAPNPTSKSTGLFSRRQVSGFQSYVAQQNFEFNYFKDNKDEFSGTSTGTRILKKKLMKVLEKSMSASLRPTHMAIRQELEETSYQFKVEFNDRPLTPQMYLANNIDLIKVATKELSRNFSRNELRSLLKNELDQKVLNLLAERYWNRPFTGNINELSLPSLEPALTELSQLSAVPEDSYWHKKLDLTQSSLTKLGIGRLSTSLVTGAMLTEINNLVDGTQLTNHTLARQAVEDAAKSVLKSKYYFTADQVENCIKPYKYEVELEDREWAASKESAVNLLREEMRQCDLAQSQLKKEIGGRKLPQVMKYLEKLSSQNKGEVDANEALGFSKALLEKGQEALFLRDRMKLLKMRYQFIKSSKKCQSKDNKYQCPEIFLDAVATKLTSTAILFLNVELLSDFYYNFPRKLDDEFFKNMSPEQLESFAKEDPKIKKHIELQERKDLLEEALSKMEGVLAIQNQKSDSKSNSKWW